MTDPREQRRLAAILAADVVGYSRLMGVDEAGTLAALRSRWKHVLTPAVARHRGRVVKVMGDGVLVEFGSAVDAVECAVALQVEFLAANEGVAEDRKITLRIGINLGDVIVQGGDLYGDGVNVAARLEGLAEPGGLCISANVHDQVKRRLDVPFDDMGPRVLRNIAEPLRVFRLRTGKEEPAPLPLPDKPSIAILPFTSMSSDANEEQFADGLTEDLITDLSRNAGLFVIARNSTFAYKGKSVDVRTIAGNLGVRYLLEGSARRAAGKVRINVQLIDAIGGGHIWAERFDRSLEDVFAVQDEVTAKIAEALIGRLISQLPRNRPKNMEAYDTCVRCRTLGWGTPQAARESYILLGHAIALDPNYAEAYRLLSVNRRQAWLHLGEPEHPNRALSLTFAEKSVALDPSDAACRLELGNVFIYDRRWAEADAAFAAALELNPNFADAWALHSDYSVLGGNAALAVEQAQKALRLNPYPPGWYYWNLGFAQYAVGHYDDAVTTLRHPSTYRTVSRRILAASLAQLGRIEEARQEGSWLMASHPDFTIGQWAAAQPFRDENAREHFVDGYRKAGLPE